MDVREEELLRCVPERGMSPGGGAERGAVVLRVEVVDDTVVDFLGEYFHGAQGYMDMFRSFMASVYG